MATHIVHPTHVVVNKVVRVVYAGQVWNISSPGVGFAGLAASIYTNEGDGVAVPLLELSAHAVLCLSIMSVMVLIARRKRSRKATVADSWEPVAAMDVAVWLYLIIGTLDLLGALLTLVLMAVPIKHDGAFSHAVYACEELSTSPAPRACCLHFHVHIVLFAQKPTIGCPACYGAREIPKWAASHGAALRMCRAQFMPSRTICPGSGASTDACLPSEILFASVYSSDSSWRFAG
jgi:hypothetical protein